MARRGANVPSLIWWLVGLAAVVAVVFGDKIQQAWKTIQIVNRNEKSVDKAAKALDVLTPQATAFASAGLSWLTDKLTGGMKDQGWPADNGNAPGYQAPREDTGSII